MNISLEKEKPGLQIHFRITGIQDEQFYVNIRINNAYNYLPYGSGCQWKFILDCVKKTGAKDHAKFLRAKSCCCGYVGIVC